MIVTREDVDYLLRQINPYLSSPLTADQVVGGYAGVRPLVAAEGVTDTKKLIRDDEVEFDPASGLVSILGGKWTTHRLMGEETIDKVQEYLGGPRSACRTRDYPLTGSAGYHWDYWEKIAHDFKIPTPTAQHLAHKYGTAAVEVLELTVSDPSLARPLVEGEAPIRAQVVYAARREMALTMEDVLARRIGLQTYGWRLAIQAAPVVATLLGQELGWSAEQQDTAAHQYVQKVNHMISAAGLESEALPASRDLVLQRG
jgi:glycerol-3-phosphate dehydrogenase